MVLLSRERAGNLIRIFFFWYVKFLFCNQNRQYRPVDIIRIHTIDEKNEMWVVIFLVAIVHLDFSPHSLAHVFHIRHLKEMCAPLHTLKLT